MRRSLVVRLAVAVVVVAVVVVAVLAVTGDEPDPGDPAAFCAGVNRLGELVASAEQGPDDVADVPAARDLAGRIVEAAEALPPLAPGEIRSEVRTLAGVTADLARDLRDFYAAIDADPSRASDPTFLDEFDPVNEERQRAVEEAGAGIRPWVERNCDGGGSTSTVG